MSKWATIDQPTKPTIPKFLNEQPPQQVRTHWAVEMHNTGGVCACIIMSYYNPSRADTQKPTTRRPPTTILKKNAHTHTTTDVSALNTLRDFLKVTSWLTANAVLAASILVTFTYQARKRDVWTRVGRILCQRNVERLSWLIDQPLS
jgi:hypothetical protein